jgi:hypothetical protein
MKRPSYDEKLAPSKEFMNDYQDDKRPAERFFSSEH